MHLSTLVTSTDRLEFAHAFASALAKRIYDELAKAAKTPAIAEKFVGQGREVTAASPAELDAFEHNEIARWVKVTKENNIKSGD